MQSRAFLSQLTVTGDESGFFYVFSQRYGNFLSHSFLPLNFTCLIQVIQHLPQILRILFIGNSRVFGEAKTG